jgi:hypothetical protein
MLGDGHDIGTSNFSNSDAAIGGVGCVEVDVIRSDTGSDGKLELLRLSETLSGQVARVESV